MLQAPAQELGVAQWYQKPGPREFFGRADECGEIIVGFRDRVREMADAGCVAADARRSPMSSLIAKTGS